MNECKRLWGAMIVTSHLVRVTALSDYHKQAAQSRHRQNVDAWFDAVEAEMKRREANGYRWADNVRLKSNG